MTKAKVTDLRKAYPDLTPACNDAIVLPPQDVVDKTNHLYRPEVRRPYGELEWPAMRRLADRADPSYRN